MARLDETPWEPALDAGPVYCELCNDYEEVDGEECPICTARPNDQCGLCNGRGWRIRRVDGGFKIFKCEECKKVMK